MAGLMGGEPGCEPGEPGLSRATNRAPGSLKAQVRAAMNRADPGEPGNSKKLTFHVYAHTHVASYSCNSDPTRLTRITAPKNRH